ncbi:hypothetical protein [Amycolatopsis sp. NPDC004169]|uniref:hypothetical protein n=1 Tax=Amycolatopsis sp. NPDC004169 TaxID=3154453 RepID=UPI0033B2C73E
MTGGHIRGQADFSGSHLRNPGAVVLLADGLRVDQDVRCSGGFRAKGIVRLVGAHIGGQLQCGDSEFSNPGGVAIEASDLLVEENVYLDAGFRSTGAVQLIGAHIEGELNCAGGRFRNRGGSALEFSQLAVDQDAIFTAGSHVDGGADLTGCRIRGQLDLSGGSFHNIGGTALDLARAELKQNMICRSGFELNGKLLLAGAEIDGNLWCEGGQFENKADVAIDATGATVGRDVALCRETTGAAFRATGKVVFNDAAIGGSLRCTGGHFGNPGDVVLTAKALGITRDALFCGGFVADGEVDLTDAKIGGRLSCTGGRFEQHGAALSGDRITVAQSAEFGKDFHADGTVFLRDANITGDLDFTGAAFASASNGPALTLAGATIGRTLALHIGERPTGEIDLSGATAGHLDDCEANWPAKVLLHDFDYRSLPHDGTGVPSVDDRLRWLQLNKRYVPQIYAQLAAVYQKAGFDDEAAKVAVAGETARRKSLPGFAGRASRLSGLLLRWTVRYGYRPLQVLWWWLVLQVTGSLIFTFAGDRLVPTRDKVPEFNSFLYTLDLLLPVVNLKQRDFWAASGWAGWVAAAFTVAGWGLALCLAVGVGRIFKAR